MARVMICDDAVFMRVTIKEILETGGHEVVAEVGDGIGVVETYKKFKPDIVTMDLLMQISGVDAIKDILKVDSKAKIIVVSVLNKQEDEVVEAIKAGALGIVAKPIKKENLLGEVERVLSK